MRLVRRQKDVVVQDCAVVLFGLCEACAKKHHSAVLHHNILLEMCIRDRSRSYSF